MPSIPRSWRAVALSLTLSATAFPCLAERLQFVGIDGATTDKIYVDMDSVQMVDGYRIARTETMYPVARTNVHGLVLDRHDQVTAFDCVGERFSPIHVTGYLNGKEHGGGPEEINWRTKFIPLTATAREVDRAIFKTVCGVSNPPPGVSPTPPPQTQSKMMTGSGILVDDDGFILTNAHVVNGCRVIAVKPMGLQPVTASLEAMDPKNDLALIRARPGLGVPATFRAETKPARLGESVGVIGYPLTGVLSNEPKATFGQVNSVAGVNNDYTLLQISAPIQPGNSGGPVLDETGLVLGIVVSEISPQAMAKVGILPQNVNFAIRGELAQIFMTAHGVSFQSQSPHHRLQTDEIAAAGEKSTVQLICMKP